MNLRLDSCSHEAARFACRAWHYAHSLPAGKLVKIGCWENDEFRGVVTFSRGNCANIGRPFGLPEYEVAELTRIALRDHAAPVSRIVSIAIRLLKRQSPGLKLIVSYSDPRQGHHGGVYQAMNWLYVGPTNRESQIRVLGRLSHPRSIGSKYGHRGIEWLRAHVDPHAERIVLPAKHKYVLPLDHGMRAQLAPLVQPYPKRERGREADGGRPGPSGRGGSRARGSIARGPIAS